MLPTLTLQDYEFTTPTLDATGLVVEQRKLSVRQFTEDLGKGIGLDLVEIPAGAFLMGARAGQGYEDERPQHRVSVSGFWMGRYPVTQEQWQLFMGRPTTRFSGPRRAVDNVSWKDASKFCEKLSAHTGHRYSLPSETQWEYACRANSASAFAFGETLTTEVANFNGEFVYGAGPRGLYRHVTLEVGSFAPNAFGLHDLHGNLWEWCADPWHDSYAGAPTDERVWTHKGVTPYRACARRLLARHTRRMSQQCPPKMAETEGDEFMGFRVALKRVPLQ